MAEMGEALRQAESRNKSLNDELQNAHGTRQELTNLNNTISSLQAEKSRNDELMKSLETQLQVGHYGLRKSQKLLTTKEAMLSL